MMYVDGSDCKEWLKEYTKKSVMDICELGYVEPSRSVVTVCTSHKQLRKVFCALHHAKFLRDCALHNIGAMEWEDICYWIFLNLGTLVENSNQTQTYSNEQNSNTINTIKLRKKREKIR